MSNKEIIHDYTKKKRIILFLDTSELLLLFVALAWGIQLILYKVAYGIEPVTSALREFMPNVPITVHGIALILCSAIHFIAVWFNNPGTRRHCILAQTFFFSYVWWSMFLAHLFIPGLFIIPFYILACGVNYLSLVRPVE